MRASDSPLGPRRRLLFTFAALPPGGKQDFRIPVAGVRFLSIGWQVPGRTGVLDLLGLAIHARGV